MTGIEYPKLYGTKEDIDGKKCKNEDDLLAYNCAQRAHQSKFSGSASRHALAFAGA